MFALCCCWSSGKCQVSRWTFRGNPCESCVFSNMYFPSFLNSVPSKRSSPGRPFSGFGFRFGQREGKAAAF